MIGLNQIVVALIFHLLDLATGLIGAFRTGTLESSKMRDGLFKKIGFIFCYVLALLIDNEGQLIGFNLSTRILPVIIVYAVTTEIISIIENISVINPDLLPDKLKSLFQINQKGDTHAENSERTELVPEDRK